MLGIQVSVQRMTIFILYKQYKLFIIQYNVYNCSKREKSNTNNVYPKLEKIIHKHKKEKKRNSQF